MPWWAWDLESIRFFFFFHQIVFSDWFVSFVFYFLFFHLIFLNWGLDGSWNSIKRCDFVSVCGFRLWWGEAVWYEWFFFLSLQKHFSRYAIMLFSPFYSCFVFISSKNCVNVEMITDLLYICNHSLITPEVSTSTIQLLYYVWHPTIFIFPKSYLSN